MGFMGKVIFMTLYPADYLSGLLKELRALSHETEWVEFKQNYANPEDWRIHLCD